MNVDRPETSVVLTESALRFPEEGDLCVNLRLPEYFPRDLRSKAMMSEDRRVFQAIREQFIVSSVVGVRTSAPTFRSRVTPVSVVIVKDNLFQFPPSKLFLEKNVLQLSALQVVFSL